MTPQLATSHLRLQYGIQVTMLRDECGLYDFNISHAKRFFGRKKQLLKLFPIARKNLVWREKPSINFTVAVSETQEPDENAEDDSDNAHMEASDRASADFFRNKLENMIDGDDALFGGEELARLFRQKYGRSYDVQLIKREFMGRQLLALNVMWKYCEQEEECCLQRCGGSQSIDTEATL